jgi:hypothetical protein
LAAAVAAAPPVDFVRFSATRSFFDAFATVYSLTFLLFAGLERFLPYVKFLSIYANGIQIVRKCRGHLTAVDLRIGINTGLFDLQSLMNVSHLVDEMIEKLIENIVTEI